MSDNLVSITRDGRTIDLTISERAVKRWRVDAGCVLHVGVEPQGKGVVAAARLAIDGQDEIWDKDVPLTPGPKTETIQQGERYTVDVAVSFTDPGASKAMVYGYIIKPDNSLHREGYAYFIETPGPAWHPALITVQTN